MDINETYHPYSTKNIADPTGPIVQGVGTHRQYPLRHQYPYDNDTFTKSVMIDHVLLTMITDR